MSGKSILTEIEVAVSKPGAGRALKRYADVFFEELLEHDGFPEEYFDVVATVLTRPSLFGVRGAEMFLYQTYASIDAVSENQKQQLRAIIQERFSEYENESLCYVVGDFIARVYPPHIALQTVEALLENATSLRQFAGLQMTVDIVSRSSGEEYKPEINRLRVALSAKGLD